VEDLSLALVHLRMETGEALIRLATPAGTTLTAISPPTTLATLIVPETLETTITPTTMEAITTAIAMEAPITMMVKDAAATESKHVLLHLQQVLALIPFNHQKHYLPKYQLPVLCSFHQLNQTFYPFSILTFYSSHLNPQSLTYQRRSSKTLEIHPKKKEIHPTSIFPELIFLALRDCKRYQTDTF
jgi:hypothetical protein